MQKSLSDIRISKSKIRTAVFRPPDLFHFVFFGTIQIRQIHLPPLHPTAAPAEERRLTRGKEESAALCQLSGLFSGRKDKLIRQQLHLVALYVGSVVFFLYWLLAGTYPSSAGGAAGP